MPPEKRKLKNHLKQTASQNPYSHGENTELPVKEEERGYDGDGKEQWCEGGNYENPVRIQDSHEHGAQADEQQVVA